MPEPVRLVHFVGFRDDRYWNAVRVFGPPDMIHPVWDMYAANDVAPGDTVVFATGEADRAPRSFSSEATRNRAARARGVSSPSRPPSGPSAAAVRPPRTSPS
ncbi:hypothetical protein F7D01_04435 [Erythrobacter sp. 3-20A1M]|nr:hypothetical protein F7D01_04435 [Erythrobacter sp. 3-20A1M]